MATAQASHPDSQDRTLEMSDSVKEDQDYFFQDRTVERLQALTLFIDDQISKLRSAKRNIPFVKLVKGICPELLLEEPMGGPKFQCHTMEINNCFCFSHKKATWYRAEAFCRQFDMTLAHPFKGHREIGQWISGKVNDASAVAVKGQGYWTSASDRFIPGQMIWMNTGHRLNQTNSNNNSSSSFEIESCLKFSSPYVPSRTTDKEGNFSLDYIFSSCFEENHFICHKFLNFFPLYNINA